jgi:hypothetical protein
MTPEQRKLVERLIAQCPEDYWSENILFTRADADALRALLAAAGGPVPREPTEAMIVATPAGWALRPHEWQSSGGSPRCELCYGFANESPHPERASQAEPR